MTREEQIAQMEQEVAEMQRRLAELRRAGPPETVEPHVLLGQDGAEVRLADLFQGKRDLIVVHNMGARCPYCTLWADGFQGVLPHLEDRAAFVVVSPDPPAAQAKFAAARGWRFRMASDPTGDFTRAMGFLEEGRDRKRGIAHLPGVSTFVRRGDCSVAPDRERPVRPGRPLQRDLGTSSPCWRAGPGSRSPLHATAAEALPRPRCRGPAAPGRW